MVLGGLSVWLKSPRLRSLSMAKVPDAVILAGGRGTRMLPGSLYMPKETMPLVDTPIINHLVWEACRAGASRVHIVLSQGKKDLLGNALTSTGPLVDDDVRPDLPREALTVAPEGVEIRLHVQRTPGGVADAISVALPDIRGAFLVLLGDNLLMESCPGAGKTGVGSASNACAELVERFALTGRPCVGVLAVPEHELVKYGVVKLDGNLVHSIIEKPLPGAAPSPHALCGRYLLPHNTAELIEMYSEGEHGELQSIAIFEHLIGQGGLEAVKLEGYALYDSGDPMTWLKSQIDHALRRDDLQEDLENWLKGRIGEQASSRN